MQPEIEAKFLDVDFVDIREKLVTLGATRVHANRRMRRKNFDYADARLENIGEWVRVRDEGDKVTLAYKQLSSRDIDGTAEVSVVVSNFDDTVLLLESIGLKETSYQETKRESWTIGEVQIEFDEWPWVKPYIEIEAPNPDMLYDVAEKLGFDVHQALHGSVEVVYTAEYDVTDADVDSWSEITFTSVPSWLEVKRR